MKKLFSWLLIAALICSLCAVQVFAADPDEIVGSYILSDMEDESGTISQMLSLLQTMGVSARLEIGEDGHATMEIMGQTMEFVFDFDKKTVSYEGSSVSYTYEDDVLRFGNESTAFIFTRDDASGRAAGPFDYYELYLARQEGKDFTEDLGFLSVYVFDAGDGIMTDGEERVELDFDFDAMTVNQVNGDEDDAVSFKLEDGELILSDDDTEMCFRLADPGHVGPYAMTELKTEDEGDMSETLETLAAMGMAPRLTIDEDGLGVLSMVGQTMKVRFDFETMTATAETDEDANPFPFSYENGTLRLEEDGEYMVFRRILEEPADTEADDAGDTDDAA